MVIIGETNNGYIVNVSKKEIANILGQYSLDKKLSIGDEIHFSTLYNKLSDLEYHKSNLNDAAKELRKVADGIDKIENIITIKLEDKE